MINDALGVQRNKIGLRTDFKLSNQAFAANLDKQRNLHTTKTNFRGSFFYFTFKLNLD